MKIGYILIVVGLICIGLICIGVSLLQRHEDSRNRTIFFNTIKISQEWAYFEGQKDAITGDVRIKYEASTKTYSWSKSCWDDGLVPVFDPSQSEDATFFLTKTNLLKPLDF